MNTVVLKRGIYQIASGMRLGKTPVLAAIALALLSESRLREIVLTSLTDAYFQVSVFVAGTLAALMFFERVGRADLGDILARARRFQVPIAALLGALPGCGGAIIVTTQYIRGKMSFGGIVAVLTATMGDAAFLLLAKAPAVAAAVFAVSLVVGIISGYIVDAIHGRDFLRVRDSDFDPEEEVEENYLLAPFYKFWMALFIPGAIIGVMQALRIEAAAGDWVTMLGLAAALLAVAMWTLNPLSDIRLCISKRRSMTRRVVDTTNFVTFWVICGYLCYELLTAYGGLDLRAMFASWGHFVPLAAVIVGFIPGCGPQIVVTTLYLNGIIPLSAQLANAISNDGDALFPAIVVAPRAALVATLYSALPACLVGYGYFFLFE
jgi:hypothetical protein